MTELSLELQCMHTRVLVHPNVELHWSEGWVFLLMMSEVKVQLTRPFWWLINISYNSY